MQNNSRSTFVFLIVFILLVIGGVYFFGLKKPISNSTPTPAQTPIQVIVPKDQPNTQVFLYQDAPPGFPKEVILENKSLNYSGVVSTPKALIQSQMKVSYQSDRNVLDVLELYQKTLPTNGWQVTVSKATPDLATLTTTKGTDSVLITITSRKDSKTKKVTGSLVTFQYNK